MEEMHLVELVEGLGYVENLSDLWAWFLWLPTDWRWIMGTGMFGVLVAAWAFIRATLPVQG